MKLQEDIFLKDLDKMAEEREYFKNENGIEINYDSTVISLYNMAHDKVGFERSL